MNYVNVVLQLSEEHSSLLGYSKDKHDLAVTFLQATYMTSQSDNFAVGTSSEGKPLWQSETQIHMQSFFSKHLVDPYKLESEQKFFNIYILLWYKGHRSISAQVFGYLSCSNLMKIRFLHLQDIKFSLLGHWPPHTDNENGIHTFVLTMHQYKWFTVFTVISKCLNPITTTLIHSFLKTVSCFKHLPGGFLLFWYIC